MRVFIVIILFLSIALLKANDSFAQPCSPNTPSLAVDLTGSPDSIWISPAVQRVGNCCGTNPPDNCVEFIITLDPFAQGIIFNIYSGAVPGGAMFYQIDCGPPVAVGNVICLNGIGPHRLTFCKPGNNTNQYIITSIADPEVSPDIIINEGCIGNISTVGLDPSTININSIYPGAYGTFNSFLSCQSGCASSQVVAQSGYPPYVDYQVCGLPIGGCSSSSFCDTVRVTFNPTLSASIIPVNPTICYGQTSTPITVQGSGGTPPYSFVWNTGATSQSINVGVGTYTVLLSDASGCPPTIATVTVTSFPSPIVAYAGPNQVLCSQSSSVSLNGSVIAASGGIWSGGSGTFIPSSTNLNATYIPSSGELALGHISLILTTTGNGNCPAESDTVNISFVSFQGTPVISAVPVSCFGGNNGSASVSVIGGVLPFQYVWNTSPAQSSVTATGLITGTYMVTVTDGNGCTQISSIQVNQPAPLTAIISISNVSCSGGGNGTASVSVFGGTPGYSYLWSTGSNLVSIAGLVSGPYSVTVTDAHGCQFIATTMIAAPGQLTATISNQSDVSCFGGYNGSATVTVNGGTPGYSYLWSGGAGTSFLATGLPAGSYTVTVTDANGCQTLTSVVISQPLPLSLTLTHTNVSCYGGMDGTVTATVNGGTPGYSYSWSPTGGSGATASNLMAGNYTCTVTDSRGCQSVLIEGLSQPAPLVITITSINHVSCYGGSDGSASVSVAGGTAAYNYNWLPSGGSSPVATGLSAGNYLISVTDAHNCTSQQSVQITQPALPLSTTLIPVNTSCFGGTNGSLAATPLGGSAPYTYLWAPSGSTSSAISNLTAGTYTVTVIDSHQCTCSQTLTITQPSAIILTTNSVKSLCGMSNGQVSVSAAGGTLPYSYLWSPGGNNTALVSNIPSAVYYVTVTDFSGCTQTAAVIVDDIGGPVVSISSVTNVSCFGGHDGEATVLVTGGLAPYSYSWGPYGGAGATATGLGAGTYTVTVTDANGCQGLQITNPAITQPPAISATTSQVNITCTGANNGSVSLVVNGGTPGFTYLWSPTGATSPNLSGLTPGIHNVTITDANGCTEFAFVDIVEPVPISVNISASHQISCYGGNDGSATASVSGGTPPYTFSWSPSGATTQTAGLLTSGTHTVFVLDHNGCSASATVFLTQPSPLSIFTGSTNPDCYNGSDGFAWVIAAGGTMPYNYSWSPSGGTGDSAIALQAGIYFVTVSDNNGCQKYDVITITQPTPVIADISTVSPVNCYLGTDGSIMASVTGGTPAYNYHWSTGSSSPFITGLSVGYYSVTINDSKGCSDTVGVAVTQPGLPLSVVVVSQNVSCNGYINGNATANANGGTPPYTYVWTPAGQLTQTAVNLIAGNYTISVTDFNGCQAMANTYISQPQPMVAQVQILQPVNCYGTNTGSSSVTVQGGTPPYSYNWNTIPLQTTAVAQNIYSGLCAVTVTDQQGCQVSASIVLPQPSQLVASIGLHSDVSCFGGSNGTATAYALGGTPTYTWKWSTTPQQITQSATNLLPATYHLTVTDSNGCEANTTVTIGEPTQVYTHVTADAVICLGDTITLTGTGSGGAGNYFFHWSQGLGIGNLKTISPATETIYQVTAYDQNGCPGIPDTTLVSVLYLFPQNVDVFANSPICPGTSSLVFATASVSSFDTIYYSWTQGLGPGPGAFVVVPNQPTTYIVTVTNVCGFVVTDSVKVNFKPLPIVHYIPDVTQGCVPLTVSFADSSSTLYDEIVTWHWNFGDGTIDDNQHSVHTYNQPDTFMVFLTIETSGGCVNSSESSPVPVYVFETPVASFTVNNTTLYLPNDPALCTNTSVGAVAYKWDFGDGDMSVVTNPVHNYAALGVYTITLIATNLYNCRDTASVVIDATGDIVFPNAFTPNPAQGNGGTYSVNDYSNQVFFPFTTGIASFHLMIFNRWGELIFESNDINVGWDGYYLGELCQEDVYVYRAEANFVDGRKVEKIGDVLLLR